MKKSRYSTEQIAFALKQAESGRPVSEVCRKMGVNIDRSISLDRSGVPLRFGRSLLMANLFGEQAIFLLRT